MWSALRSRDFRLLWASQSASVVGDALVIVAIGLYVTRLTGRPRDVGIVLAAYSVPLVLFLLVGGVVADRLPRQFVIVAADTVRCVLHGTLAVLIATGAVRIWQMAVIGALFGTAQAFFQPAYTGLIPQTVEESDIQSAQALGGFSRELATFASPAIATALVLGVGGAAVFGADAATFAFSALIVSRVRPRSRVESTPTGSAGLANELRDGWSAVRARAWVWATIAGFSVAMLVSLGPFFTLGAEVAGRSYGSEAVYGITNVAWGAGTVTGVVIGARWRPERPMLAGVLASTMWPAAIAVYGAGAPLTATYPVMAMAGVGIGLFGVWWETALAQRIPPQLLSRVSAWDWMGSLALLPLGYLIAGPIAAAIGASTTLVAGGAIGTLSACCALLPRSTRTLRRIESAAAAVAEPRIDAPSVEAVAGHRHQVELGR